MLLKACIHLPSLTCSNMNRYSFSSDYQRPLFFTEDDLYPAVNRRVRFNMDNINQVSEHHQHLSSSRGTIISLKGPYLDILWDDDEDQTPKLFMRKYIQVIPKEYGTYKPEVKPLTIGMKVVYRHEGEPDRYGYILQHFVEDVTGEHHFKVDWNSGQPTVVYGGVLDYAE